MPNLFRHLVYDKWNNEILKQVQDDTQDAGRYTDVNT